MAEGPSNPPHQALLGLEMSICPARRQEDGWLDSSPVRFSLVVPIEHMCGVECCEFSLAQY